jgi:hypothetical protein
VARSCNIRRGSERHYLLISDLEVLGQPPAFLVLRTPYVDESKSLVLGFRKGLEVLTPSIRWVTILIAARARTWPSPRTLLKERTNEARWNSLEKCAPAAVLDESEAILVQIGPAIDRCVAGR